MTLKEIEKISRDIRRSIGKGMGYRQSDYINWKFQGGYFFCLNTFDLHNSELEVKPIFMDDLYWQIIYPDGRCKLPDSLRGTGMLSHLGMRIWNMDFPKNIDKKHFSADIYEELMVEVFSHAEEEIEKFLTRYSDPDRFDEFLKDENRHSELGEVLLLIRHKKYEAAYILSKTILDRGPKCSTTYTMDSDDGDCIDKNEYEFIKEYCLKRMYATSGDGNEDDVQSSLYFIDRY